jgi:hypothetical protein
MTPIHIVYFLKKYKITPQSYNSIYWRGTVQVDTKLTATENMRLAKLTIGWLSVGHKKRHMRNDPPYNGCRWSNET